MKFSSFATIAAIALLAACSSGGKGGKKVVIWSNGTITLDAANKTTVNFEPSNRHNELEVLLAGSDNKITIKTSAGEKAYDVPDAGVYLLNLKVDTVIGSIVSFGSNNQRQQPAVQKSRRPQPHQKSIARSLAIAKK